MAIVGACGVGVGGCGVKDVGGCEVACMLLRTFHDNHSCLDDDVECVCFHSRDDGKGISVGCVPCALAADSSRAVSGKLLEVLVGDGPLAAGCSPRCVWGAETPALPMALGKHTQGPVPTHCKDGPGPLNARKVTVALFPHKAL